MKYHWLPIYLRYRLAWDAALLCILLTAVPVRAEDGTDPGPNDLILNGDAVCTRCHDEADQPDLLRIGQRKHGTRADGRTPGCTSCHGKSELHISEAEDGDKDVPAPTDVDFGHNSHTEPFEQNAACLQCHQTGSRINWKAGTHANRNVTCVSCHAVHLDHDPVQDPETQADTCFDCHKQQRSQLHRPSHHPVLEGEVACSDCHDVHGDNPKHLARSSTNETCYTCHMEKRGPFVHNHQPVTEDCAICHNPHGTMIDNLLKSRPPYLCQGCHSHTSHPGQLAGLPGGRTNSTTALGSIARGCLNCHTNIHGGNSTASNATAGRFRR